MITPISVLNWYSERANPLLVRILRQELRNNSAVVVYLLMLTLSCLAAFIFGSISIEAEGPQGPHMLYALYLIWGFIILVLQPVSAFRMFSQEREDQTWDLVTLTGLPPGKIVLGLLKAKIVYLLFISSAVIPFILLAYLLRGLDLLTIGFTILTPLMTSTALMALGIFLATVGRKKTARALWMLLFMVALMIGYVSTIPVMYFFVGEQNLVANYIGDPWEFFGFYLLWLNVLVAVTVAATVLAHSILLDRAENKATGPRLLTFGLLINIGLWMFSVNSVQETNALLAIGFIVISIFGIITCSESYVLTPAQAAWIRRGRSTQALRWLIGPGGHSGKLFFLTLTLLWLAFGFIVSDFGSSKRAMVRQSDFYFLAAHVMIVIAGADIVTRSIPRRFQDPVLRRLATISLFAATAIVPPLISIWVSDRNVSSFILQFSPGGVGVNVRGTTQIARYFIYIMGAASVTWLLLTSLRFKLKTANIYASQVDWNPRSGEN